ncbi:hypothetical protein [Sporosarcina sp. Te-1]|nr:hypothetical protein [Sporosarcina sp. Te-1]QTD43077.1 hypothetical protein J3U78_10210 [Sporosarcina sp. Te-1]
MHYIDREVMLRHIEDLQQKTRNQRGAEIRLKSEKRWKLSAIWTFFL